MNSSGPGLGSAVETVPTTTVPETMAPETMAPENTEALTPENTCKPCLQDCAEAEASVSAGRGREHAERDATRNAGHRVPASPSAQQRIGRRMNACARRACLSWMSSGRAGAGAVQGGRAEWPSRGVRACASARRARAQSVHATGMLHGTPHSSACASLLNRLQVYLTLQGGFICRTPFLL